MSMKVKKAGEYLFNSSKWREVKESATFTLTRYKSNKMTLNTTAYEPLDDTDGPYLFLIPQTLTAWDGSTAIDNTTGAYIQLDCTIMQDSEQIYSGKAYIPFGATLVKGVHNDVKINIGKNSLYSGANTKIIQ